MKLIDTYESVLKEGEKFISDVIKRKYCLDNQKEKDYNDVLIRIRKELNTNTSLDNDELNHIMEMMEERRYIPAGSVSFGLGNNEVKCSLSNCYFTPIEQDSIEGIFEAAKKLARTFSYRGGCVAKDSLVILKNKGLTKIQDVNDGDKILSFNTETHADEFQTVLAKHSPIVAREDNIKIILDNGTELITSRTHPTLVFRDNGFRYVKASEVNMKDAFINTPDINELSLDIEKINDPDLAWLFATSIKGRHFYLNRVGINEKVSKKFYKIYNRDSSKFFKEYFNNQFDNKSIVYKIPKWIWKSDRITQISFLAGMIDAQSEVCENGDIKLKIYSKKLSNDIKLLLNILKTQFSIENINDTYYIITILNYPTEIIDELLELISDPVKKKSLKMTFLKPNNYQTYIPDDVILFFEYYGMREISDSVKKTNRIRRGDFSRLWYELYTKYENNEDIYEFIGKIVYLSLRFVGVKEIKYHNDVDEQFYDLTVDKNNNYYSGIGGLSVIHNSGVEITILRPKNAKVNNAAIFSSGAISFVPLFSNVAGVIGQNGRRGAEIILLNINHPDSLDFIWCKSKPKEIFGQDPLTGKIPDVYDANITIKLTRNFMIAVEKDEDWQFRFPDYTHEKYDTEWKGDYDDWEAKGYPFINYHKVKAREILRNIAESAWISGDPGVSYWDTVIKLTPGSFDPRLKPTGLNPCLPGWIPVLTPDGYKRFSDINTTIFIQNQNNNCSQLFKTQENAQIWEIKTRGGLTLYSTDNHLVSTDYGDIEVSKLDPDKHQVLVDYSPIKYKLNKDEWEKGLLAGWCFADGSIFTTKATNKLNINFCIGETKFECEEYLTLLIHKHIKDSDHLNFTRHGQKSDTCLVFSTKKKSCTESFKRDIFEADSKDEFDLINKSISYQIGFVNSFITCEGNVQSNQYRDLLSASQSGVRGYNILKQIQLVLASLGIYSSVTKSNNEKIDKRGYKIKDVWSIEILDLKEFIKHFDLLRSNMQNQICLLDSNYSQTRLDKIINLKKKQKIKEINKLDYKCDVFDITVPNGNHFVAGGIIVHNCGEQPLANFNNCLLSCLVLHKYVINPYQSSAQFNIERFLMDVIHGVIFLDTLVDINIKRHPVKEQREADEYGRRIGQEFTGLADCLAMLGMDYESDESIEFIDYILYMKAITEFKTSIRLSKDKGPAPCFKTNEQRKSYLQQEYIKKLLGYIATITNEKVQEKITSYEDHAINKKEVIKEVMAHGLRNSAFNTVGPTGTISIVADNCTSGVEPLFAIDYFREVRLQAKGNETEKTRIVHFPLLKHIGPEILNMDNKDIAKKYHYTTAHNLDYRKRIRVQSAVQKWTDSSVSSTLNLNNDATIEEIYDAYIKGYESNLKGMTVFRDGSKKGILTIGPDFDVEEEAAFANIENYLLKLKEKINEPQRSYRYVEYWKKAKIYLSVTIDDKGRPIEIFSNVPYEAGINELGDYSTALYMERTSYWHSMCRLTSLLLRSRVPIYMICNQLRKSSPSMVDLPAVILRVLNKYNNPTEINLQKIKTTGSGGDFCIACKKKGIVYIGGCAVCQLCGDTKCG